MLVIYPLKPIPRWIADEILQKDCSRLAGFQLPIVSGEEVANFPGMWLSFFYFRQEKAHPLHRFNHSIVQSKYGAPLLTAWSKANPRN